MTDMILTQNRIEIDVYYDGSLFFYNRRVNGQPVVVSDKIPLERARQIIEANAGGDTTQTGLIDFENLRPFSWTVRLWEGGDDDD